jgi:hypothetical protein
LTRGTFQINYTVTLNSRTPVNEYEYVQVGVPSLTGTKTVETQYKESVTAYTDEEISAWTVDKYDYDYVGFYVDKGGADCSIENLPAGLTAEAEGSYLRISGTPTEAGVKNATLKATDEYGNTLTKTVYFIIGSEKQIAGAGKPEYTLESRENDTENNVSTYVRFIGGSGYYNYTIENDGGIKAELSRTSNGTYDGYSNTYSSSVYVYANVKKKGTYTVKVKATDQSDSSISFVADVVIHVEKAITVTGTIKDANGNGMPYDEVSFENKDKSSRYGTSFSTYAWDWTDDITNKYDENGNYTTEYKAALKSKQSGVYKVRIPAGTYDVTVNYSAYNDNSGAEADQYKKTFSADTANCDFTLPLYKVTITGDSGKEIWPGYSYRSWSIQKGESLQVNTPIAAKEGDADYNTAWVYLKAGAYTLETAKFSDNYDYKSTTTYTDKDNKTSATVPANGWFDGYTSTYTSNSTYDMCKLTANVTVGNTAVTVPAAKTTVETGKKGSTYTYKYVYEGLNKATATTTVTAGTAFNVARETSKDDDDENLTTYSYASKSVFTPSEDGDYTISDTDLKFYKADGTVVAESSSNSGYYTLTANTAYIIADGGEGASYTDVKVTKFSAVN